MFLQKLLSRPIVLGCGAASLGHLKSFCIGISTFEVEISMLSRNVGRSWSRSAVCRNPE